MKNYILAVVGKLSLVSLSLVGAVLMLLPLRTSAAGVTLITHGLSGNTDTWVASMANAVSNYSWRTTNAAIFRFSFFLSGGYYYLQSTKVSGGNPSTEPNGETIIMFDWRQLADGNSYNTYQIAAALAPALTSTNFISELGGHAVVEFPIHLVGHSRGGSLICELSRLLGTNGVWVDHVTTLDAHPLNNDGFSEWPLYTAVDAPARIYQNVLFADSYYQDSNLLVYGEPAQGAFYRKQTDLTGGYTDVPNGSHADIHLWYHGTIDWRTPTSDSEAWLTTTERAAWWTSPESYGFNSGFTYSVVGGGNRLSLVYPNGYYSSRPLDGYNQWWNLGAGIGANRSVLVSNSGNWPSPIKLNLTSTNVVSQGDISSLYIYYQWAKAATASQTIGVYLDDDLNPLNGNERLVKQVTAYGTTAYQMGAGAISVQWNATNTPAGTHTMFVKFNASGNIRYLYAPEFIRILTPIAPSLDIRKQGSSVVVGVVGAVGQTMVLQQSTNLTVWTPLATNTLTSTRWETSQPAGGAGAKKFFRAIRQ